MPAQRRIRIYRLDERMFSLLLREGAITRCMRGVPSDADFAGATYDFTSRSVLVAFDHPSFDEVPIGAETPRAPVAFELIEHPQRDLGMHIPIEMGLGPLYADDYSRHE